MEFTAYFSAGGRELNVVPMVDQGMQLAKSCPSDGLLSWGTGMLQPAENRLTQGFAG